MYLDRPLLVADDGTGLGGAVRIQRLEGSRFHRSHCSMGGLSSNGTENLHKDAGLRLSNKPRFVGR